MDPEFLPLVSWIQATGPFGLVCALAWAYSKLNEKKDSMLRDLYAEVVDMGRAQTEAVIKMEAALVALKDAIDELRRTTEEDQ